MCKILEVRAGHIKGPMAIKIYIEGHRFFFFFFFFRSGILSTSHLKCLKDRGDYRKLLAVVMV